MSKMPPDNLYPQLFNFSDMMRSWLAFSQLPSLFQLNEPILPNGTFAGLVINQNNSTNPQVERHVVNHVSYGRQLGVLIDTVDVLLKDLPTTPKDKADAPKIKAFKELKAKIDDLKSQARESQVEHIIGELEGLSDEELRRCGEVLANIQRKRAG